MTNYNGYTSRAQVIRDLRAKGFTFSTALGATESNPKLAKGAKLGVLSKPHNLAPGKESGKWNLCSSASPGCLIACLNTAGNPIYLRAKLSARIQRTHAFMTMRKAYIALMAWKLGFRNGQYDGNSAYISEGVVNLSGATYMFLSVNDYNNYSNTFFSAFNESLLNKDILGRIAVASSSRNAITYSNIGRVSTPRQYFGPVDIEKMQIQLLDEFGRIVNLNNMDFSICLSLTKSNKFPSGKDVPTWPENVSEDKK